MALKPITLAVVACLGLAACGDTVGEQAVFGGAVGAGATAIAGGPILAGAAVGAGANVLACQATDIDCN